MTAVEFDVDGVDAVLPGDEPDSVLVWRTEQWEILVKSWFAYVTGCDSSMSYSVAFCKLIRLLKPCST